MNTEELARNLSERVSVYAHNLAGERVRIASGVDRNTAEVIVGAVERGDYAPYVPPAEID